MQREKFCSVCFKGLPCILILAYISFKIVVGISMFSFLNNTPLERQKLVIHSRNMNWTSSNSLLTMKCWIKGGKYVIEWRALIKTEKSVKSQTVEIVHSVINEEDARQFLPTNISSSIKYNIIDQIQKTCTLDYPIINIFFLIIFRTTIGCTCFNQIESNSHPP